MLLTSTKKAEKGELLGVGDIVQNDEMGYLLKSFYKMNKAMHKRSQKLDYKAHHDELTGLRNRSKMLEEIGSSLENLKITKMNLAIFFLDLNDFKILNDTLGHEAGDIVLKETANCIKEAVRSSDNTYRVGGDEFVVLLKDITSLSQAEAIARKILTAAEKPISIQGEETNIKLSIGIAMSNDHTDSAEKIVKHSDIAMYQAKQSKKPDYKVFNSDMLKRSSDG